LIPVCVRVLRQIQYRLWWIPWDRGRHNLIPVKLSLHNLFANYNSTLILNFPKPQSFLILFGSRIDELIVQLPFKTISKFQPESETQITFVGKAIFGCVFSNHLRFLICAFRILLQKRVFGRSHFYCGLNLSFWLSLRLQKCVWVCMITFESCLVATSNFGWNCVFCMFSHLQNHLTELLLHKYAIGNARLGRKSCSNSQRKIAFAELCHQNRICYKLVSKSLQNRILEKLIWKSAYWKSAFCKTAVVYVVLGSEARLQKVILLKKGVPEFTKQKMKGLCSHHFPQHH